MTIETVLAPKQQELRAACRSLPVSTPTRGAVHRVYPDCRKGSKPASPGLGDPAGGWSRPAALLKTAPSLSQHLPAAGQKGLVIAERIREIPVVRVLHADASKRIVLPSPVRPHSAWVPVLVSEKEIRLIAYEPPKESTRAKGRVVIGSDGLAVWDGEMVMDPVKALNQAREEDANG